MNVQYILECSEPGSCLELRSSKRGLMQLLSKEAAPFEHRWTVDFMKLGSAYYKESPGLLILIERALGKRWIVSAGNGTKRPSQPWWCEIKAEEPHTHGHRRKYPWIHFGVPTSKVEDV